MHSHGPDSSGTTLRGSDPAPRLPRPHHFNLNENPLMSRRRATSAALAACLLVTLAAARADDCCEEYCIEGEDLQDGDGPGGGMARFCYHENGTTNGEDCEPSGGGLQPGACGGGGAAAPAGGVGGFSGGGPAGGSPGGESGPQQAEERTSAEAVRPGVPYTTEFRNLTNRRITFSPGTDRPSTAWFVLDNDPQLVTIEGEAPGSKIYLALFEDELRDVIGDEVKTVRTVRTGYEVRFNFRGADQRADAFEDLQDKFEVPGENDSRPTVSRYAEDQDYAYRVFAAPADGTGDPVPFSVRTRSVAKVLPK